MPPPDSKSLYGAPRPKNTPIPLSSTSIHALTTELALAQSAASPHRSVPARSRPSSNKTSSLFKDRSGPRSQKKGILDGAANKDGDGKMSEDIGGAEESLLAWERGRRALEEKARRYRALMRGEENGRGEGDDNAPLVDFDRKWVESEEEDQEEEDGEQVEYEDEFGRTRLGSKAEAERAARAARARDSMNLFVPDSEMRIREPRNVIYGNHIQTHAFSTPLFEGLPSVAELKSTLPTKEVQEEMLELHYDSRKEVRTKGVGFYQFSENAEVRKREMEELEKERLKTERERELRKMKREERKKALDERREKIRGLRRQKQGGSWLEKEFGEGILEGLMAGSREA
ncbi:hypothetical protein BZA77DRAFT_314828 [Pyronema omphalodes]|nr:hypothetical protein BZA77DRAFT_314828 [Pyronema omphalodes]